MSGFGIRSSWQLGILTITGGSAHAARCVDSKGHLEDPELLTSGAVKPLSDYRSKDRPASTVYRHPPTHRFFVDYETLEAYRLRYENRYLEDFVPCAFIPQAAAPTPATTVEPTSGPLSECRNTGRPTGSGKLYPDAHRFVEILGKGADGFYLKKYR